MLYEQLQRMLRAWKGAATAGSNQQQQGQQQRQEPQQQDTRHEQSSEQALEYRQQELKEQEKQQQQPGRQELGEHSAEMRRLQEAWQQLQALHQQQQRQQQQQQQPKQQHEVEAAAAGSRLEASGAGRTPQDVRWHSSDPTKSGHMGEHSAHMNSRRGCGREESGKSHLGESGAKPVALGPLEIFTSSALAKVRRRVSPVPLLCICGCGCGCGCG
eukprot:1157177-Pelagomonas_calceolata.AAC.2